MTGSITNIDDLKNWFHGVGYPYFTLSYQGTGSKVIFRNTTISDMNESWEELRRQVEAQGRAGRAMLEVITYKEDRANAGSLRTNIDIRPEFFYAHGQGPYQQPTAGVNSLPIGYVPLDEVERRIEAEHEKWELRRDLDDLKAQIGAPTNMVEKAFTMLGEYPQLAALANNLLVGLMGKNNPAIAQSMQAINGHPAADHDNDDQAEGDPNAILSQHLYAAANRLGTDPVNLVVALNRLVQANPDVAKTLLQNEKE